MGGGGASCVSKPPKKGSVGKSVLGKFHCSVIQLF